jgi:TonB-linked SusC/RagA family outer membrane protein
MNLRGRGVFSIVLAVAALGGVGVRSAAAQDAVIRGVVRSDRGEAVAGAIVYLADLTLSTTTRADGSYELTVPGARVSNQQLALRVRGIGFKPGLQTVTLSPGEQSMDFTLETDIHLLEAVVVTGVTGGTEQIKVPFAVSRIDATQMPVPAVNPMQQLQGKAPGVQIVSASGRPGQAPAVIIRGPKSLNSQGRSQEPLYIVDGVTLVGGLPDINPGDIQSVDIVPGAAGSSLYGAQASNGVVQITTRRGAGLVDQLQFRLRSEAGVSDIEGDFGLAQYHALLMDETNQFFCQTTANQPLCARVFDYATEAARINNDPGPYALPPAGFPVDPGATTTAAALRSQFQSKRWPGTTYNAVDQVVNPSPFYRNTLDMSGRFGSTSVFASLSNTREEGAIRFLEGYTRNALRVNVDQRIGNAWSVALSSYYARSTEDGVNQQTGGQAFFRLTRVPGIVNVLETDTLGRLYVRPNLQAGGAQNENPLQSLQNIERSDLTNRFLGGVSVRYTPLNWLELEGNLGYDGRNQEYSQFTDKGYRTTQSSFTAYIGSVFRGSQEWEAWNGNITANLRGTHLGGDLRSRVTGRYLFERQDYEFRQAQGNTLAVQGVSTLDNTTLNRITESSRERESLIGVAGGLNLDYKDRYVVDLLVRRDGSSLFGEANRWQTFGRGSFGWRMAREPWWPMESSVSEFKVRTSYGTSGGRPRFSAQYETFTIGTGGIVAPNQLGNANLGPERNTEFEAGADVELFRRLLINFTYADSRTEDQILPAPVQSATGFTTQWINAGTVRNKVYELAINMPVIQQRDLRWQVGFTYDRIRSVIEELYVPPYDYGSTSQATTAMFRAQVGEQIGTFYGMGFARSCSQLPEPHRSSCGGSTTAFQYNDEGYLVWVGQGHSWQDGITQNLWQEALPAANSPWGVGLNWGMPILLRDNTGTPLQLPLGNALPDFRWAFNTTLQWKKFTVYGLIDAAIGQDVWNQGRHWAHLDFLSRDVDQAGKPVETAKPIGYYWRGSQQGGLGGFYNILAPNSHFVEDASYAKLRELLVSYAVGPVMGFGSWEVSVIGRNLFTISDYTGFDPEVGQTGGTLNSSAINAVDAFTFPNLRSFTFAVSMGF